MDLKLWEDFVLQYISDQNTTSCALGIEPILKQALGWDCQIFESVCVFSSLVQLHIFLALLCLFELLHHETWRGVNPTFAFQKMTNRKSWRQKRDSKAVAGQEYFFFGSWFSGST